MKQNRKKSNINDKKNIKMLDLITKKWGFIYHSSFLLNIFLSKYTIEREVQS